jgi:hypothetical protein
MKKIDTLHNNFFEKTTNFILSKLQVPITREVEITSELYIDHSE